MTQDGDADGNAAAKKSLDGDYFTGDDKEQIMGVLKSEL